MAMVRFATTCDIRAHKCPDNRDIHSCTDCQRRDGQTPHTVRDTCGERSKEWEQWPTCRYCSDHCCPAHTRPNSLEEDRQYDGSRQVVCTDCSPENADQLLTGETLSDIPADDDDTEENPREKGDDDGVEYGDPRDAMEDRDRDL